LTDTNQNLVQSNVLVWRSGLIMRLTTHCHIEYVEVSTFLHTPSWRCANPKYRHKCPLYESRNAMRKETWEQEREKRRSWKITFTNTSRTSWCKSRGFFWEVNEIRITFSELYDHILMSDSFTKVDEFVQFCLSTPPPPPPAVPEQFNWEVSLLIYTFFYVFLSKVFDIFRNCNILCLSRIHNLCTAICEVYIQRKGTEWEKYDVS
jgi:hypothetical protein